MITDRKQHGQSSYYNSNAGHFSCFTSGRLDNNCKGIPAESSSGSACASSTPRLIACGASLQEGRQGIFRFADALLDVGDGSHYLCIGSLLCAKAADVGRSFRKCLYGFSITFQYLSRSLSDLQLAVEHKQGIIHVGNVGNNLCLYSLAISLCLFQGDLCILFGVQQLPEQVYCQLAVTGNEYVLVAAFLSKLLIGSCGDKPMDGA